jgi:hypothetical protein
MSSVIVWDNGRSYDENSLEFIDLPAGVTDEDAGAVLRLNDSSGRIAAKIDGTITWSTGATGGGVSIFEYAARLYAPPEDDEFRYSFEEFVERVDAVPVGLLAGVVSAMRKAKRSSDEVAPVAKLLRRRRRSAKGTL